MSFMPFVTFILSRFDERKLFIICGIIPMIVGRVIMLPIPGQPKLAHQDCLNNTVWDGDLGSCVAVDNFTTTLPGKSILGPIKN